MKPSTFAIACLFALVFGLALRVHQLGNQVLTLQVQQGAAHRVPSVASPRPSLASWTPRPVSAPPGTPEHEESLRELRDHVSSLERDAWDWRWFYGCIHKHYRVHPGDAIPVTWKVQKGCVA